MVEMRCDGSGDSETPRDRRDDRPCDLSGAGGGAREGLVETMTTRTYTAICQRSQGWWAIRIPEVRGAFSQARRLGEVERMVRDVVSLVLEVPPDSFDVRVEVTLPEAAEQAVRRAAELRHEAQLAAASAGQAAVDAARLLVVVEGLTMREAGQLLGISHQRVAQILREARAAA